jgi:DNA gyrase subunit A
VKAILELRLHRLTALGRDEIGNELEGLATSIGELLEILANRARLYEVMREEFDEVEAEFATPRMSELAPAADGIEDEDLIEVEDMVVTVTMTGYIKRTPLSCSASRSAAARAAPAWRPRTRMRSPTCS